MPVLLWALGVFALSPHTMAQDTSRNPSGVLLEPPNLGPIPGSMDSSLGPSNGALEPSPFANPDPGIIGGRRRGGGRVYRSAGRPKPVSSTTSHESQKLELPPLPPPPHASLPSAGTTSAFLTGLEDPGPPHGITLDAAIGRVLSSNLELAAMRHELPQADADILTAGLRTNPIVYMDTQFIPYGSFTNARPGGPTQYDLNITYPLDLSRKRYARVQVARAAKRVLEAQYQDVVRREIGNVYRAFVDLQAARASYIAAEAGWRELQQGVGRELGRKHDDSSSVAERMAVQREKARSTLDDASDAVGDAQEALGLLLGLPAEDVQRLETRGSVADQAPPPPPLDVLMKIALTNRPDLVAARLGLARAGAEVRLARANRLDDVYLFYDPITYQDNRPAKVASSHSWDIGLAIPLPIYNRNQGNLARARQNVCQTQAELAALERRIASEVRQAHREYYSSRTSLERIARSMLPHARASRDKANREFAQGQLTLDEYLGQLDDDGETIRLYRDAIIRHRRSMLDLNTAVSLRILP